MCSQMLPQVPVGDGHMAGIGHGQCHAASYAVLRWDYLRLRMNPGARTSTSKGPMTSLGASRAEGLTMGTGHRSK